MIRKHFRMADKFALLEDELLDRNIRLEDAEDDDSWGEEEEDEEKEDDEDEDGEEEEESDEEEITE